jgi:hypothetical protein
MGDRNRLRPDVSFCANHSHREIHWGNLRHRQGVQAAGQGGVDSRLNEPVPVVVRDHGLLRAHQGLDGVHEDGLRYAPTFVPLLHTTHLVIDALTTMWEQQEGAHLHPPQALHDARVEQRHDVALDQHEDPVQERGGDEVDLERAHAGAVRDRHHHLGEDVGEHHRLGEDQAPRPLLQSAAADVVPARARVSSREQSL